MLIFKRKNTISDYLKYLKNTGKQVGFVPTMGALHDGHLALIDAAAKDNDVVMASIFVNPTQFNNKADLEKYPRTTTTDIEKLAKAGTNILFLPEVEEMYPADEKAKDFDIGYLGTILEGDFRPGHYQGVSLILYKFLSLLKPDNLYLGQKDYQQVMVIQRLIDVEGFETEISIVPTLREKSGLAMSSRNMRLSEEQKATATIIFESLNFIKDNLTSQPINSLAQTAEKMLEEKGMVVDYVTICDAKTLTEIKNWNGKEKLVALIAAYLGEIRLIDNMLLN